MKKYLQIFFSKLEKLAHYWWFAPLIAVLSALDAYVVIIPNEALLISAVTGRPKKWFSVALWGTFGSALGALSFAALASLYGDAFINFIFPKITQTKEWIASIQYIQNHGLWGLAFVSISPLPQHAAVAIAGLAHMPLRDVFFAVVIGRMPKYLLVCWATIHSRKLLVRLHLIPSTSNLSKDQTPKGL